MIQTLVEHGHRLVDIAEYSHRQAIFWYEQVTSVKEDENTELINAIYLAVAASQGSKKAENLRAELNRGYTYGG